MAYTLAQLRTPVTQAQQLQTSIDWLEAQGFPASSWQSGGVRRTMLELYASGYALLTQMVDAASRVAFNDDAEGDALTEFSRSHYQNVRVVAVAAELNYVLTGAAVGPPHVLAAGDLQVTNAAGTVTFTSITGGTVPASGTLSVTVRADLTGTVGNLADGTVTTLRTPFAGVTGSNDPPSGATTSITTQGVDEEADTRLRQRNASKWPTLSNNATPPDAYINHALEGDTDVTRVVVDASNPRGAGTVDIYIARATGIATGTETTPGSDAYNVKQYIEAGRRPVTADVEVLVATGTSFDLTATVSVTTALNTAAKQAEIEQAATDFINGLPIGGTVISGTGYLLFSELITAVSSVVGVVSVSFSAPAADSVIASFNVATVGTIAFTYNSV